MINKNNKKYTKQFIDEYRLKKTVKKNKIKNSTHTYTYIHL